MTCTWTSVVTAAVAFQETPIELKYAPKDAHMLDGSILQAALQGYSLQVFVRIQSVLAVVQPQTKFLQDGKSLSEGYLCFDVLFG